MESNDNNIDDTKDVDELSNASEIKNEDEGEIEILKMNNDNDNTSSVSSENSGNFDIFAEKEVLLVHDEELIPEFEREYDDFVYQKDIENSLLAELPIYKQNNKYLQKEIYQHAQKIIELKNEGLEILERSSDYSRLLDDYQKSIFSKSWIVPIVLDRQKIYKKIDDTADPNQSEIEPDESAFLGEYLCDTCDENSIELVEQKEEFEKERELRIQFKKETIKYDQYYRLISNIIQPFTFEPELDGKAVGSYSELYNNYVLLRYYNINNSHWKSRTGLGPFTTTYEYVDEEKRIHKVLMKTIIPGEKINIVGFLILPRDKNVTLDIVKGEQYKPIGRFGKLGKIGEITSITQGTNAIFTVKDHGLEDNEYIYIAGTNSIPSADGRYRDTVKVINNNQFTIDLDTHKGEAGDSGTLYGMLKLDYEVQKITSSKQGKIEIENEDRNHYKSDQAKLYSFENFHATPEQLKNILSKIIPSVEDIISIELDSLKRSATIRDMNKQLDRYKLNLGDLNIDQLAPIKKILQEHVDREFKERRELDESKLSGNKKQTSDKTVDQKGFDDPLDLFANKYFYSDLVKKYYGTYPFRDIDSSMARMCWIRKQVDRGDFYYAYTIYEIVKLRDIEGKKVAKAYVEQRIDNIKKDISRQKKMLETELKTQKFFEKEQCQKYAGETDSMLCNLENSEGLKGLKGAKSLEDLNKIECMFVEPDQCRSRRVYRVETRLAENEKLFKQYQERLEDLNQNRTLQELANHLKSVKTRLEVYGTVVTDTAEFTVEHSKTEISSEISNWVSHEIFNQISKIENPETRKELIYRIIVKDGVLIDDYIYSRKYKQPLICGHWDYYRREDYTDNYDEKVKVRRKLLDIFGDGGGADHGEQTCRVCGSYLGRIKYDENEGLDDFGDVVKSRELWMRRREDISYRKKWLQVEVVDETEKIICQSKKFKRDLLNHGLKVEQLRMAIEICERVSGVTRKIGIQLKKDHMIELIISFLNIFSDLPNFEKFRQREVLIMRHKGVDERTVERLLITKYFQDKYQTFLTVRQNTLISARLLIFFQTTVPPYPIGKQLTSCSFTGFEGDGGIEFFLCILKEMRLTYATITKDGVTRRRDLNDNELREAFIKSYEQVKKRPEIQIQFDTKQTYQKIQGKKLLEINTHVEQLIVPEAAALPNDFITKVKDAKTKTEINALQQTLEKRLNYIRHEIKLIIHEIISESQLNIAFIIENSCCREPMDNYLGYASYFDKMSDGKMSNRMNEMTKITPYLKLFLNKGSLSLKLFPFHTETFQTTFYVTTTAKDITKLIKLKFERYCSIGDTKGEHHLFTEEDICVKCGQYLKKIRETVYTQEDFDQLLDTIIKLNTKLWKEPDVDRYSLDMKTLKHESLYNIGHEIDILVSKLSKILGKDKEPEFKNKYKKMIKNLGIHKDVFEEDKILLQRDSIDQKMRTRNIIKLLNHKEETRIKLLKNYINDYIRKYISILASGFDKVMTPVEITTMDVEYSKDLQKEICEEYEKFSKFLVKGSNKIFKKLRISYTINEINNIQGHANIYDCSWTVIKNESKFDLINAGDVLLYIFVTQLKKFLLVEATEEMNENAQSAQNARNVQNRGGHVKITSLRVIANFIVTILDMIESDDEINNISNTKITKYKECIIFNQKEKRRQKFEKMSDAQRAMAKMRRNLFDISIDEFNVSTWVTDDPKEKNLESDDKDEALTNEAKRILTEQSGIAPSSDQIEIFKEKYLKEEATDRDIADDEFNLLRPKEGLENIEEGDDYAEMPQGTENAGDGISDFSAFVPK